jgi:hypothetical protein
VCLRCDVWTGLYADHYVSCLMDYITMSCVLCYGVSCIMYYVLYVMYDVLYVMYDVLYVMYDVLCIMHCALCMMYDV